MSTLDPELEALFNEYYSLLSIADPDADQRARITELRQALADKQQLGQNRRERLMLDSIDRFLARERMESVAEQRQRLKDETIEFLQELWEDTGSARESRP